jgi:hypothetical protein
MLFKVMHSDIKKLCNEYQELRKEVIELKSIVVNSNSGGGKMKKNMLDYDSSWLMVCTVIFIIYQINYS